MEKIFSDKGFQRILFLFILVNLLLFGAKNYLTEVEIAPMVVGVGNAIIFFASTATLMLYGRAKNAKTSHGFSRNIYAAFVTKFFILVTAAMLYFYFAKDDISTKAVFVCLGLYFVYHFTGAVFAARVEKKHTKGSGH
jgi:hypothetical protein